LREAARVVRGHHVAPHVRALVVPGSQAVRIAAEREGLHDVFRAAGFRLARRRVFDVSRDESGSLNGREVCASSSNRNFKGVKGVRPADAFDESGDGGCGSDCRAKSWMCGRGERHHERLARVTGRGPAMVLPGDDIDTDRIMPARFLKAVTFEGLESHLFEDDRKKPRAEA
jgi:aconitase A